MEALVIIIGIFLVSWLIDRADSKPEEVDTRVMLEKLCAAQAQTKRLKSFQIRTVEQARGGAKGIVIEGQGLFPISRKTHIGIVTSVIDITGGENHPVITFLDGYAEPTSRAYQFMADIGDVKAHHALLEWAMIGVVVPSVLYPPEGGDRSLLIVSRIIDMDNPPDIFAGHCDKQDEGLLKELTIDYKFYYEGKGYIEYAADRDEARSMSVKLAMTVAMADGSLDDSEGNVIKTWIKKTIAPFPKYKQEKLKKLYNDALRESYQEARSGDLSVSDITERLEEVAETPQKYEAVELCFEVMAADGVADENELETIKDIVEALDLDFDEIEKLRDKHLVDLNLSTGQQASIETILHIDPNSPKEQIKKNLRTEFAKWNNRINTLDEGPERENAQHMLNLIAEARQKYV